MDAHSLHSLSYKNFSEETNKKIRWVTKMYHDWRNYRHSRQDLQNIPYDLDDISTITEDSIVFAMTRFLTEVKKLDGTDFPPNTLYDIVICVQFHLESMGFSWKLLSHEMFHDVRFIIDNLMKLRTSQGIRINVHQAEILSTFDEDLLWGLGLLGDSSPQGLLDTVVFLIGKGCALRAGKEHRQLRAPPYNSQFQILCDGQGKEFIRYSEEIGNKMNKGGLKHRKVKPKIVDVYPISEGDTSRCPVHIISKYLSLFPQPRKCTAFYLQARTKFRPGYWFKDRPIGSNTLREVVKELCKKAGLPGFFSNHSLRLTCATTLYQNDVDEQLIQEITRHRSLAVRAYKRTCDSQCRMPSICIFSSQKVSVQK